MHPSFHEPSLITWSCAAVPLLYFCYLDAVLVEEAWQGETLFLVEGLAEDDQLFEEEDSPLLHPAEQTALRVRHHERVLQQKASLSHDLPLERETGKVGMSGVGRKSDGDKVSEECEECSIAFIHNSV